MQKIKQNNINLTILNYYLYLLSNRSLAFDNDLMKVNIPNKFMTLLNSRNVNEMTLESLDRFIKKMLYLEGEPENIPFKKQKKVKYADCKLVQNGLFEEPIVDELILHIFSQMNIKKESIWPNNKVAAVCLSHDVDLFEGRSYFPLRRLWWKYQYLTSFVKGNKTRCFGLRKKMQRWSDQSYDPVCAFENWMKLEDRFGFRSTFFFFGLKRGISLEGRLYSVKNPKVRETIRELDSCGWEVGLHASSFRYLDIGHLREQKESLEDTLGKEVSGCRQHLLRFVLPNSWAAYSEVGFKYSSNVGFGGGVNGFRAGTCIPYYPITPGGILEVPFQLMDSAGIADVGKYFKMFINYKNKVKKVGGCLVMNFHQEYFDEIEAPGTNSVYRMILENLSEDDELWVAPLREVCLHLWERQK